MNPEAKTCQNCKIQFTIEPDDFAFYERIHVPPPTFCPQCRFERRIAYRNERKLYRTKSAKSGKSILSLYPPEGGAPVYEQHEWYSDDWDPMSYGRDYDFSRPFFAQFFELVRAVPRYNLNVLNMINSDYSGNADYLKNCYLLFNSNHSEDCAYGNGVDGCRDCYDVSHVSKCEQCYDSFWLANCYQAYGSSQCEDCNGVWFSKNCRGCSDCFGCVNLRDKKYHIFNQPYSKEEYRAKLASFELATWKGFSRAREEAKRFWKKFPNKFIQGIKNTDVSGEYVTNSKNVHFGYLVREGENLKYVQYLQFPPNKDCQDITIWGNNNQLCYENAVCGLGAYNLQFCVESWPDMRDSQYCIFCTSSVNLFGCVGVRKKEYCILNKQYPRDEYYALREKIIAHMNAMPYADKKGRVYRYGEFFPIELSYFAYNQTIAPEHFPLTKEQAEEEGYEWRDPEQSEYETTMRAENLPDSIDDASDDIVKEIIRCERCGRAYRIIQAELQFLRQQRIPLLRTCVDCRHTERISQRNKSKLFHRRCVCPSAEALAKEDAYKNISAHFHGNDPCPNEFETSYAPDRPEIVYCEKCYQAEAI